ncbi:MAG: hypothetical protein WDO73_12600 [Ignavibacteriota bacterium]
MVSDNARRGTSSHMCGAALVDLLRAAGVIECDDMHVTGVVEIAFPWVDERQVAVFPDTHRDQHGWGLR